MIQLIKKLSQQLNSETLSFLAKLKNEKAVQLCCRMI